MQRILTKREKIIVFLTGAVILGSAIFKLLDWAVLEKNEGLSRQISFTKMKLAQYQRLLSQRENIMNKYGKFSGGGVAGQQKENLVDILTELESIAKEANIKIIDLRPQSGAKSRTSPYKENTVDVTLEGDMEGYLRFIYNLENSLSLLRVNKFRLSAKPNSAMLDGSFSISQISPSE